MATISELLALADDLYPNVESVDAKINYMNMAQDKLAAYFGKIIEDDTLSTVAEQDIYAYPTGLNDISEILSLGVAGSTTPLNRYDYTLYSKNYAEDNPMADYGYFQVVDSNGAKKFVLSPIPETSGYKIIIRYKKKLAELSSNSLTSEPEFDSSYHRLLSIYCCHLICSKGASPDAFQADMFMQKFESGLSDLWAHKMQRTDQSIKKRKDNPQWHKHRSYGIGF